MLDFSIILELSFWLGDKREFLRHARGRGGYPRGNAGQTEASLWRRSHGRISGYSHHTLCCSVAASCGSDLCSTNYSKLCYFAIYLHGESLSEQLTNATIQLRVRFKLHQRQQRLKHLHRLPNAITTLVILNPLLRGYWTGNWVDCYFFIWLVLQCKACHFRIVHLTLDATLQLTALVWMTPYGAF